MKTFTNISNAAIAKMLGLELVGRECVIQKAEDAHERYLVAQINLYLILQFHANSNSGLTDLLSVKDLAEQLSCTPKTVYRSLDILDLPRAYGDEPLMLHYVMLVILLAPCVRGCPHRNTRKTVYNCLFHIYGESIITKERKNHAETILSGNRTVD